MLNKVKNSYYTFGAVATVAAIAPKSADASTGFSVITDNMTESVSNIPGLITVVAYLFGILLAVLGVLKIKDHVENPSQTPLREGAIRSAAGGALFALPIIFEAATQTIGTAGNDTSAATISKATAVFND